MICVLIAKHIKDQEGCLKFNSVINELIAVDKIIDLDGSSSCSEGQIPVPKDLRKEETSPACSKSHQSLNSVSPCQPILQVINKPR